MNETELKEGMVIADRYQLRKYLGSGSFGEVWMATDTILGIDIAVKLYLSLDASGQEEFKDEYRITFGLSDEHLLTTDFFGIWQHRPFLTMKYCAKGSAAKMIGNVDERVIWQFTHDVAAGLRYLHNLEPPILHQDIKPENILADDRGHFLITDFGISRKMRSTMRKQSKRSVGSGALAYLGPERFQADPIAVKASDVWSLGVSIYEMATGDLPFAGNGGGMMLNGAQLPRLDRARFSSELNDLMQACLAKDPWERPTADQIVEYTDLILRGRNEPWHRWFASHTGVPADSVPITGTVIDRPAPAATDDIDEAGGKSHKGLIITVAAILLLALAGAGVYLFRDDIMSLVGASKSSGSSDDTDREAVSAQYRELFIRCRSDIDAGNKNSYLSLVEARQLLDSITAIYDTNEFLAEKENNDPEPLRSALAAKADEVSALYLERAPGMAEAGNFETAAAYYQIAGLVKPDDSRVFNGLDGLARRFKSPGVFMAVKAASLDGSELTLDYVGLCDRQLPNVRLEYTLSAGGHTFSGSSTVTVRCGDAQSLRINLSSAPAAGSFSLRIVSGQLVILNRNFN